MASDAERLFLANLPLLERLVAATARRYRLTREEAEDFGSVVKLKLIAGDYEVLRTWEGRSSLAGYLASVVQRAYLDHCNHLWGKWRPSAEARRLGPLGIRLDTWLHRDGLTLEQACALAPAEDRAELRRIAERLPSRVRRQKTGDEDLASAPAPGPSPEAHLLERERDAVAAALGAALARELDRLPDEDRLLLRLRYHEGATVATFARSFGHDQKQLYRRLETLLRGLRRALEAQGFDAGAVAWALGPAAAAPESAARVRPLSRDEAHHG